MIQDVTWAGLQAIQAPVLAYAQELVATGREVSPQLLVLQAEPDGTAVHEYHLPSDLTAKFFTSGTTKNAFAMILYDMLSEGSFLRERFYKSNGFYPNVLVQVNEAWVSQHAKDVDVRKVPPPSEDPNRKEVLLIALHTATHTVPVFHYIEQNPRRVVRGTFPTEGEGEYRGWFAKQSNFDYADTFKAPTPASDA